MTLITHSLSQIRGLVLAGAMTVLPLPGMSAPDVTGEVARAQFTREVVDREPVDTLVELPNDENRVLFFSEVRDMQGQTVTHRWEYQGRVMAEVSFRVDGPRWRVYSEKRLLPEQTGMWTVMVVNQQGWPLRAEVFKYTDAMSEPDVDEPATGSRLEREPEFAAIQP